jgi:cell division protein ZipA
MDQHLLTIIIVVILIVGIIFDGVRRMRKARYDSLQMQLKTTKKKANEESDSPKHKKGYGSEFPNGGARVSNRTIDPERIKEVRNKYNFGSDMSSWRERVVEKIAEHRGKLHDDDHRPENRIEPSFEADPLMDDTNSRHKFDIDEDLDLTEIDYSSDRDYSAIDEEDNASFDTDIDSDDDEIFDYELYDKAEEALEDYLEECKKPLVRIETKTAEVTKTKVEDHNATVKSTGKSTSEDISDKESKIEKPKINKDSVAKPVQVSLNLDDSVPMLMDTFDDKRADSALAKKSLNPFSKQPQAKNSAYNSGSNIGNTGASKSQVNTANKATSSTLSIPEEVLVIHVRASADNVFYGNDLLELILEHGLRYGAMNIFHRHSGEDGEGPILFSLSNMVKPGIFDLHTFEEFTTVGVSLFLALPVETGSYMEAFESMLATAKGIAKQLDGELKDENRSVLTGQTIEHYRERIRDFSRRQRLEKR